MKIKLRSVEAGTHGPLLATFMQGRPPVDALFPPVDGSESDRALRFTYAIDSRRSGRGDLAASSESGINYSARSTETASSAAGYK